MSLAWITGGSRGIGFSCATALGGAGYRLAISARNGDELDKASNALRDLGYEVFAVACDVAVQSEIDKAYEAILHHFGEAPDVLINNAGVSPWTTFSETSLSEFDQAIAVNLRGVFLCSKVVLPAMFDRKDGAIVNILSVASLKAYKNGAAYVASKFGALGFTNALRDEARKHGVRVISVLPGATETEMWGETERAEFHERMMQPEDIALAVVQALKMPKRAMIEEILMRPIGGDL